MIALLVRVTICEHLPPQNWYSPLLVACLAGERCNDAVEVLLSSSSFLASSRQLILMATTE